MAIIIPTLPPSSTKYDLVDLVEAIKAGDPVAANNFSAACGKPLADYARRRGSTDPEGVANLTILQVLARIETLEFANDRRVWSYLYTAVRYQSITHHNVEQRRQPEELDNGTNLDSTVPGTEDEVVNRVVVEQALAQLTPNRPRS